MSPIYVFDTPDRWTAESVAFLAGALADGQRDNRWASLALSGGSSPAPVYQALAADARVDWQRVRVYFCDERCVPPDHEESNARLAREHLIGPAAIPDAHVFPMDGAADPPAAAAAYDALLREHFEGPPRFDAAVLGMGSDGHTCSLFPSSPALRETARLCVHTLAPPGMAVPDRLTLTYPALAGSRHALFLVRGAGKREPLREALQGHNPAGHVALPDGELRWHTDTAAADG